MKTKLAVILVVAGFAACSGSDDSEESQNAQTNGATNQQTAECTAELQKDYHDAIDALDKSCSDASDCALLDSSLYYCPIAAQEGVDTSDVETARAALLEGCGTIEPNAFTCDPGPDTPGGVDCVDSVCTATAP